MFLGYFFYAFVIHGCSREDFKYHLKLMMYKQYYCLVIGGSPLFPQKQIKYPFFFYFVIGKRMKCKFLCLMILKFILTFVFHLSFWNLLSIHLLSTTLFFSSAIKKLKPMSMKCHACCIVTQHIYRNIFKRAKTSQYFFLFLSLSLSLKHIRCMLRVMVIIIQNKIGNLSSNPR